MIRNPKIAAIIGIILCIPAVVIFLSSVFGIELSLGSVSEGKNVQGSILILFFFIAFPVVSFVFNNFGPERSRLNRGVASFSLGIVIAAIVAAVVDQYPCWVGEPNCD